MENDSRTYAEEMLKKYFKTFEYPFTAHQLNSFDQFVANDMPSIIKSSNPILLLEDKIGNTDEYAYRIEIFIGGIEGNQLYIGTPTVSLRDNKEVRVMYPNEARLRNLTYASNIEADISIKITFTRYNSSGKLESNTILLDSKDDRYKYLAKVPLFRLPIMLHSRYCLLRNKPNLFLQEVGESPYDYGGYFIVDGSEKVLITRQEQAFNTLYVTKQKSDPKVEIFASIQCLNPITKQVKRLAFGFLRNKNTIEVSVPFVRKPIPLFVLFRALGIQTDEDILRLIFPNPDDIETKLILPLLHESILDAHPFVDSYSAIQYIRVLTKGFSEAHVYNILYNQVFIHIDNKPMNKVTFLAECVRKILRVYANIDTNTDRDDIRNQRCLTSGLLTRMLFQNTYTSYIKAVSRAIDKEYKYNTTIYEGDNFLNIFLPGNMNALFLFGFISDGINRGFKGKWSSGAGEEKSGALQPLSRLSYLDFLSHCRRVVLDIDDTAISLPGPHRLHTTQFGYFCTSETPGGKSIGITKNLSMLTAISLSMDITLFKNWLFDKMDLLYVNDLTTLMMKVAVPLYINNGIIGYTLKPEQLVQVCKLMKHTGCLPAYSSISFNIRERRISLFLDEGRLLRPLIHIEKGTYPFEKIQSAKTWRELVIGNFDGSKDIDIVSTTFRDPLVNLEKPSAQDYINLLKPHVGIIEYVDPYESNEAFVAMYPELIKKETTHVELHPSSIVGLLTSMIPFPNHNQSPRNQLSCSQSKQGISMSSTNFKNRFDNQNHVLCYGEAPLVRTLYYDYVADGQIGYGHNLILAMGCFTGYNQEDGIVMNLDSFQRGMFRNMTYKSYEAFEEDDEKAHTKTRITNPSNMPGWTRLKAGVDYRKLDERGIVKKGEYVDENTVIVGRYIQSQNGEMNDASITAQVWTSGIVEEVCVTVNNKGLSLVKIRVIQDRIPELGDKFCLTDDHDVLTKDKGWVRINEVTVDDEVAQLNINSNTMEYVKPNEVFMFDHTGEMYEVESQGLSLKTTLNHRMWIQQRNSDKYELIEASKIIGKRVRYQSSASINNIENDIQISDYLFSKGDKATAWLYFFGIWIAEGWTYIKESDSINRVEFAANKRRVYNKLKESCEILNWNYSYNEKSNKFYVNEKKISNYLDEYSVGAINKYLPKWVFNLSLDQTKILLEGLCLGDGYKTDTSLQYFTSSVKLKNDIQHLVQHAGWSSYASVRYEKGWVSPIKNKNGKEFKANSDAWVIGIRKTRINPTINHGHTNSQNGQKEGIINFNGKVYCLSVPSEVFLVRRNGKVVFTGNSNRHGQKGTIGMLIKGCDMPRSSSGMTPDMMMNPHAIPSRMTIAQLLESMLGKAACLGGFIGDATAFMNEGGIEKNIGDVLEQQFGFQRYGEELFYDGMSGSMIPSTIFVGNVYTMRLKHMVEDKWNARGAGRREQKTHQPTGGRGNQGGLRIGEMERDALLGHGISSFIKESYMKRSDGTIMVLCNGCGTVPIYNQKDNFYVCPLCDGPVQFVGDSASNFEILPTMKRSVTTLSEVEIPYSLEVLNKELNTYVNMYMRFLTSKDITSLKKTQFRGLKYEEVKELLSMELKPRVIEDTYEPNEKEEEPEITVSDQQLEELGANISEEVEDLSLPNIDIQEAKNNVDKEMKAESIALDLQDTDDIEVVQTVAASAPSLIVQQPMMMTQQQYVLVPTMATQQVPLQVISSQVPNAPQTLVVDTSPQAMEADGIDVSEREIRPLRSILKRPNSPSRFNRSASPTRSQSQGQSQSQSQSQSQGQGKTTFSINKLDSDEIRPNVPSNTRINIVKEGE
uniref:DNA-directed RNA polymerase n=1 Tax=viral metagenome TaxID=1070528 RepID=A0A6C0D7D4_9ZZZZ